MPRAIQIRRSAITSPELNAARRRFSQASEVGGLIHFEHVDDTPASITFESSSWRRHEGGARRAFRVAYAQMSRRERIGFDPPRTGACRPVP
jgi:hypothetical protein